MNKIAEALRYVAEIIPRTKREAVDRSPYICDLVDDIRSSFHPGDAEHAQCIRRAHDFLHFLGMGSGLCEFVDNGRAMSGLSPLPYAKAQNLRITWLLFAADLAEEWKVR
jgi:hypothetical protein